MGFGLSFDLEFALKHSGFSPIRRVKQGMEKMISGKKTTCG
jgi:hypothetical protein